ncbi:hypothetical protein [Psychrilyobacter sp.]|uniref:hypothetical protein n=1 Tax=Psychrilyobacter sp. TaxID=2586924 RepID=UPI003015FCC7
MKILKLMLEISLLLAVACGKEEAKTAVKSNEVTVYSSHPSGLLTTVTNNFTEKTGIKVNIVGVGTGEILKRVQAESVNPLGDVVWGGGAESLNSFKEYFAPYKLQVTIRSILYSEILKINGLVSHYYLWL